MRDAIASLSEFFEPVFAAIALALDFQERPHMPGVAQDRAGAAARHDGNPLRESHSGGLGITRSQPFVGTVISETAVVTAFIDALRDMEEALTTPLKSDLLSTFERKICSCAAK